MGPLALLEPVPLLKLLFAKKENGFCSISLPGTGDSPSGGGDGCLTNSPCAFSPSSGFSVLGELLFAVAVAEEASNPNSFSASLLSKGPFEFVGVGDAPLEDVVEVLALVADAGGGGEGCFERGFRTFVAVAAAGGGCGTGESLEKTGDGCFMGCCCCGCGCEPCPSIAGDGGCLCP